MHLLNPVVLTNATVQILMLGRRRQDLTPAQFRAYYEDKHIPFMKNLTGATFPLSHERHYIKRECNETTHTFPAVLLPGGGGDQADWDFDAVAILTYRNRAHFDANWAYFEDPVTSKIILEDEEKFSEWVKGVFLQ